MLSAKCIVHSDLTNKEKTGIIKLQEGTPLDGCVLNVLNNRYVSRTRAVIFLLPICIRLRIQRVKKPV